MIVSSQTYNTTDPTIDSQVVSLKASGADVFLIVTVPKFSAQAIRKAYDIDWHPQEIVVSVGSSIAGAIRPAGFEAAKGVISAAYQKDPADPQWKDDPAMKAWNVWMDKYNPHVDKSDYYAPYGYNIGYAVVQLLKQCGDNLTRENVMKQASHLDMQPPLLLPGIRLKHQPDRPPPDPADAAGPLQRRALCAVQRRAREPVTPPGAPALLAPRRRGRVGSSGRGTVVAGDGLAVAAPGRLSGHIGVGPFRHDPTAVSVAGPCRSHKGGPHPDFRRIRRPEYKPLAVRNYGTLQP